jgi:hypothetical protein
MDEKDLCNELIEKEGKAHLLQRESSSMQVEIPSTEAALGAKLIVSNSLREELREELMLCKEELIQCKEELIQGKEELAVREGEIAFAREEGYTRRREEGYTRRRETARQEGSLAAKEEEIRVLSCQLDRLVYRIEAPLPPVYI